MKLDQLESDRLILRPFVAADAEQFIVAVAESGNTVGRWLSWWKSDLIPADALDWFRRCNAAMKAASGYDIGLFQKDDGTLLGSVAINRIDAANRTGSLGYWVRESQQGKGFCSEAARRIAAFGFEDLKLKRLEIVVLVENAASRRVAEKCGACLECIAENRLVHQGESMAAAVYSLVA